MATQNVEYQVQMHLIDNAGVKQNMCPKNYLADVRTGQLSPGELVLPGSDPNENLLVTMANIKKYLGNLSDIAKVLRAVSDNAKDTSTVNIPSTVVTTALSARADALERKCAELENYADRKAPTMHADAALTYGGGTAGKYGHVKLSDVYSTKQANAAAEHSIAASQNALNAAWADLESRKADNSHADSGSKYGLGSSSLYGHVKTSGEYRNTSVNSEAVVPTQAALYNVYHDLSSVLFDVQNELNMKARENHAWSTTKYGAGSSTNFGHLKVNDNYDSASQETGGKAANGVAASSWAVKRAYDAFTTELTRKLDHSHSDVHGTTGVYGHVKLTDSYNSNNGAASTGTGASSKALFDAYTAITAITTGLQTSINTLNTKVNTDIQNAIDDLKESFQDGVDTIYDAIVAQGTTPGGKSPAEIATAIETIGNIKYEEGYTAGEDQYKTPLSEVVSITGSKGDDKLAYRNDIDQTCSFSRSNGNRTVKISVSGYNVKDYGWTINVKEGVAGILTVTGTNGKYHLPTHNDLHQKYGWKWDFSPTDGVRRLYVYVTGSNCSSYHWEIRLVKS